MIDITSKYLQSGETVPLNVRPLQKSLPPLMIPGLIVARDAVIVFCCLGGRCCVNHIVGSHGAGRHCALSIDGQVRLVRLARLVSLAFLVCLVRLVWGA